MGPSLNVFAAIVFFVFVRSWLPRMERQSRPVVATHGRRTLARARRKLSQAA